MVLITTHTHAILKSKRRENKEKEKKKKAKKERKKEKKEKKRQEDEARKLNEKKHHTSRPYGLNKDGIGLIEGIKCINGTGGKTQQGEEARAVLR